MSGRTGTELAQIDDHRPKEGPIWPIRAMVWIGVYLAILLAWIGMVSMASDMPGFGLMRFTAPALWQSLCLSAAEAEPFALFGMWMLMSVAMMLPTFVPALRTFLDLGVTGASDLRSVTALVAGYLGVWVAFSAIAAIVQAVLAGWAMLGPDGASTSLWLTALLLFGAGLYQFSQIKEACLSKCRAPLTFFMERWSPGPQAALKMGGQLGVHCLGCCWALMLLGFVGGTMNLVWMGVATLFMIMEKLPEIGAYLTRPVGWILLGGGCFVALQAVGIL